MSPIFQNKVKKHKIGPEGSKYRQAPKEQFQSHPHFEVEIETKRVKEELLRRGVHREREREQKGRAARRHPPPRGGRGCSLDRASAGSRCFTRWRTGANCVSLY